MSLIWWKSAEMSQFWPNYHILGALVSNPSTKPGQIWQQTVDPQSTLTRQISFESVYCVTFHEQKNNFGQNLSFGVSYTQPPLPIMAKFGVLEQTHGVHLHAKFRLDDLLCRPLLAKNSNFVFFGLRHFVVSPVNGNLRKLNTGAQPQTFPYPTVSKKFLYSNSFMAKSYAETPSPRWRVESKPHQVWHGDRGPPAHSCTSKRVQAPTYIITTMGCWKLRETRPLSFSKIFSFWDPIALYLHQLKLVLHAKFHPLSATCHPCGAKNLEVTLWVT